MKLDTTVAVVTGAGGGIGRELVTQLVDRGARVAGHRSTSRSMQTAVKIAPKPAIRAG